MRRLICDISASQRVYNIYEPFRLMYFFKSVMIKVCNSSKEPGIVDSTVHVRQCSPS
ncbi:unnamed protein product [Moneuplotes crassus]|uniref:Uncharacterized protein n=1 Tax=Euplotes crassus TaxID=5936 RepID=A0AAD1XWN2_EUPCR|nr:unnamed protein product [Moneuplotes crassus]